MWGTHVQVTQHVSLLSKWVAADLYAKELDLLQFELSMNRCSVDLWAAVEAVQAAHAHADVAGVCPLFANRGILEFVLCPQNRLFPFVPLGTEVLSNPQQAYSSVRSAQLILFGGSRCEM
jgi:hypothetical protein